MTWQLWLLVVAAVPVGGAVGLVIAAKLYDFDEDWRRVRRHREGHHGKVRYLDANLNELPESEWMK